MLAKTSDLSQRKRGAPLGTPLFRFFGLASILFFYAAYWISFFRRISQVRGNTYFRRSIVIWLDGYDFFTK